MSVPEQTVPALTVSTVAIDDVESTLELLPPRRQLLWLRRGDGMAGFGEAARLEFSGPTRMTDAAAAWRRVAAAASVEDGIGVPGSGLIAFGAFAFSDHSPATSVLVVPSVVLGRRNGRAWLTRIRAGNDIDAPVPSTRSAVHSAPVAFTAGALPPDAFLAAVDAALNRIDGVGLSKVVLAREIVGRLTGPADTAAVLSALATGYPDCWTFAVDDFLGSSPETLVAVTKRTVTARVLAGSAARGTDAATDQQASLALATSAKDQDEHQYAVQSVLAALRPHSPGVTSSEQPFTLRLPNLWHLASDVEGTVADGSSSLDLIDALHPTAAVAGTPTPAAVALIEELEPFDRGRYAGPVGWVGGDGDGEWAIALRCCQVEPDGTVRAYAGAGIVAESVAEHELAETSLKFRPIVEAFAG
ncbi:menaquinone-specific isochorismate synthase [Cryobacterium mesophilum]|nr:isochorismate synthase [Terrimesophilobacter mesophilus]MBB5633399.1 menaquinone-specific isochorismate synthase [Terrimesophilobacter mesophilus]